MSQIPIFTVRSDRFLSAQPKALPGETPLAHAQRLSKALHPCPAPRQIAKLASDLEAADDLPERMGNAIQNFRRLVGGRAVPLPRLATYRDDGEATTGTLPTFEADKRARIASGDRMSDEATAQYERDVERIDEREARREDEERAAQEDPEQFDTAGA